MFSPPPGKSYPNYKTEVKKKELVNFMYREAKIQIKLNDISKSYSKQFIMGRNKKG